MAATGHATCVSPLPVSAGATGTAPRFSPRQWQPKQLERNLALTSTTPLR